MKTVEILKNCFLPGRRTPSILTRGSILTIEDAKADALIAKKYAAPVGEVKAEEKPEETTDQPKEPKRRRKEKVDVPTEQ